ncbi:MAG TPA: ribonuclease HII [Flavobacteriales bacterium]|nr:ribonuclease HII [Flavobacteriales bacterium]
MLKKYFDKNLVEAGCDEAGRGCLAGPVVAAAVILPKGYKNKLLNDSKKLTHEQRETLRVEIEKKALTYAIGFYTNEQIDEVNILNASFYSMHLALDQLSLVPEHILIDGNRFIPYKNIKHTCVIKGDGKYMSIAAASILAKTYRDAWMKKLHEEFTCYNWAQNKGYPTEEHRKAIAEFGSCKYHRKSFTLLPDEQLELFNADEW